MGGVYGENYKIVWESITDNLNKWSWIVRFNIIKISVLSKLIYTLDLIKNPSKTAKGFPIKLDKLNLNFINNYVWI